jgi:predicted dinucleotide-binding enzyme
MRPKVGIIGDGNVGSALQRGLQDKEYDVRSCGKEPQKVQDIATWADVLVLAVPFHERENAIREMGGAYRNKPLVDATNALTPDYELAVEPTRESGAEQLQKMAQSAKVVKAFNTVFAKHMDKGHVNGEKITLFVAGNDPQAKDVVRDIGRDLGFDPVDSGRLQNARWMETLGMFNIQLGQQRGLGQDIGFKLVR